MYIKISRDEYNRMMEIYNELFMMAYHLPNFKTVDTNLYIDLDSIHENVKPLLIHKDFKIETFFYDPRL
jgi:hypothetical protein